MAFWDKLGTSGDVEDRRGMGGLPFGGNAGLVAIGAVIVLGFFGVNADPKLVEQLIAISGVGTSEQSSPENQPAEFKGKDNYEVFASTVVGSTNNFWSEQFSSLNKTYETPRLVLFRQATQSGCGVATSDVGPHYCPADKTIYLDETFFGLLEQRFGGNSGDVAQAYVIAHEVGHNVQHVLGIMEQVQGDPSYQATGDNSLSVKLELQADCYAGMWAGSVRDKGIFESPNEIQEAIQAASAVGDDHIQQKTQGSINPETWTHGSSAEREAWFKKGYDNGDIKQCSF